MKVHLSKELKEKHKIRRTNIRKGDTVKVIRGKMKGKEGVVEKVSGDYVYIENLKVEKQEGKRVSIPIHASNLILKKIVLEDKKRKEKLGVKKK